MKQEPNAIVIIPTYDESENVGRMVDAVMAVDPALHLLIVDDNSPDGTGDIVKDKQVEYPNRLHLLSRKGKAGLGTAYIAGFQWALERPYNYIFEMDCDFSHNPDDLYVLLEACEKEADVAIGSRYVNHMVNVVNWPMGRVLLSYFASMYVRFITRMNIMDTTAGFVCYKRKVLEAIPLAAIRFKGYAFQIEMKFRAKLLGFKLVEVPIIFTDRTAGESKMSKGIIKEAFLGVIQLKIRSLINKKRFNRKG